MHNENRFLDTFRGHNIRPIMALWQFFLYIDCVEGLHCGVESHARVLKDPLYTVPDSLGHDIQFGKFAVIFILNTSMIS